MARFEVKIKMPSTIADGRRMHEDLIKFGGKPSSRYDMWRNHYERDETKYHGGFEISFIFYDEENAHAFNNIWERDEI